VPHVFGRTRSCGIARAARCHTQQYGPNVRRSRGPPSIRSRARACGPARSARCLPANAPYALPKTLLCVWISQTAAASRPKTTALHALHRTQWIHGVAARKAASRVFMRRVGLNFAAGKIQEAETA
jgi:hypothetical protein